MQGDKDLGDGLRQALVHRKSLAAPVAGRAEPLELIDDRAAGLVLPLPYAFEKLLAPHLAPARLLIFHQLAFDDHLRRDAGMVGARLPQHVLAVHAVVAAQDVLQGIVERVAHVQIAGDIWRRDDNAERFRPGTLGTPGAKRPGGFPLLGNAGFHSSGFETLFHESDRPYRPRRARVARVRVNFSEARNARESAKTSNSRLKAAGPANVNQPERGWPHSSPIRQLSSVVAG